LNAKEKKIVNKNNVVLIVEAFVKNSKQKGCQRMKEK